MQFVAQEPVCEIRYILAGTHYVYAASRHSLTSRVTLFISPHLISNWEGGDMRTWLITACCVAILASVVLAQTGGHIGIYSDNPGFSDCNLTEVVGQINAVYVAHTTTPNAWSAQLKIQDNWGAFPAGEHYSSNLFIPSTSSGLITDGGTVVYGGCRPLPHLVVMLLWAVQAPSGPCGGTLVVVPDPAVSSGQIEAVACDGVTALTATGGILIINRAFGCPCDVATEETSWSRIKAMYR
jgi:hypothetical protein